MITIGKITHYGHSVIVSQLDRKSKFAIYKQILKHLSNGRVVIYAAEPNPTKVIRKMSKIMAQYAPSNDEDEEEEEEKDLESYIASGALTVIDRDELYSNANQQFDVDDMVRSWHSLLQTKRKSFKSKRVVAIGSAVSVFLQTNNIEKLLEYEDKISSGKIPKAIETICLYNNPKLFGQLRYSQLLPILNAHEATVHTDGSYRQWFSDTIIAHVCDGIDAVLGKGASNLVFKTLKMVYNLDSKIAVSKPELFEEKVTKLLGKQSAALCFKIVVEKIKKEMEFARIDEK